MKECQVSYKYFKNNKGQSDHVYNTLNHGDRFKSSECEDDAKTDTSFNSYEEKHKRAVQVRNNLGL